MTAVYWNTSTVFNIKHREPKEPSNVMTCFLEDSSICSNFQFKGTSSSFRKVSLTEVGAKSSFLEENWGSPIHMRHKVSTPNCVPGICHILNPCFTCLYFLYHWHLVNGSQKIRIVRLDLQTSLRWLLEFKVHTWERSEDTVVHKCLLFSTMTSTFFLYVIWEKERG